MSLPITTVLVSAISLLLLVLSSKVVEARRSEKVSLGDGGNEKLLRRQRGMANLVEYAPFALIMCGLAELQGGNQWGLAIIAAIFFIGRVAHGYSMGFTDGFVPGRYYGTIATFAAILILALYNLFLVFANL